MSSLNQIRHSNLTLTHGVGIGVVVPVAEVEGAVPEGALLRLVVVVHMPVKVPLQVG